MTTENITEQVQGGTQGIEVLLLGTADAFNTGGRANSAYWVTDRIGQYVVDFGPTALIQSQRYGKNLSDLDAIYLTHLHGDHIGGLPMLLLHSHYDLGRRKPLKIVGPPSTEEFLARLWRATYPSTTKRKLSFDVSIDVWKTDTQQSHGDRTITTIPAVHAIEAEPHSLKIEMDGTSIGFSGDTGWQDNLGCFTKDCALFVCEATNPESGFWGHLSVEEHRWHRDAMTPNQLVLSHMTEAAKLQAIADAPTYGWIVGEDGMTLTVGA